MNWIHHKNHTFTLQEAAIYLSTTNPEEWESMECFTIINENNQKILKVEEKTYFIETYSNHTIHLIDKKQKIVLKARNGALLE